MTNALRRLGIMVFKARLAAASRGARALTPAPARPAQADIHTARIPGKPLQEVHRFLLTDAFGQPIDDPVMRDRVVKQARAAASCARAPRRGRAALTLPVSRGQVRGGLLG